MRDFAKGEGVDYAFLFASPKHLDFFDFIVVSK